MWTKVVNWHCLVSGGFGNLDPGKGATIGSKNEVFMFLWFFLIFFRISTQNIGFCRNREENQKNIKNWETHVHLDSENHQDHYYVSNFFQDWGRHPRVRGSPIETHGSRWCCKWSSNSYYTVTSMICTDLNTVLSKINSRLRHLPDVGDVAT